VCLAWLAAKARLHCWTCQTSDNRPSPEPLCSQLTCTLLTCLRPECAGSGMQLPLTSLLILCCCTQALSLPLSPPGHLNPQGVSFQRPLAARRATTCRPLLVDILQMTGTTGSREDQALSGKLVYTQQHFIQCYQSGQQKRRQCFPALAQAGWC
jgi:hypothetical protein